MPLDHLLAAVPGWFNVTGTTATEIFGSTSIRFDDIVGVIEVDLRVHEDDGVIAVQEQVPGTRFPGTCHERHLQSDKHFCIGFNAGYGIVSFDHGVVWWGLLKHFLRLQRVAERTRQWPPQQEVAHGSAGPHQLAALDAAKELGIANEYMAMLAGETAWFSDPDLKIDAAGILGDGSLPCPVGCATHGILVPRSECCRSHAVAKLVIEEKLRREKVESYYSFARMLGEECCGTMLTCGLKDSTQCAAKSRSTHSAPNSPR